MFRHRLRLGCRELGELCCMIWLAKSTTTIYCILKLPWETPIIIELFWVTTVLYLWNLLCWYKRSRNWLYKDNHCSYSKIAQNTRISKFFNFFGVPWYLHKNSPAHSSVSTNLQTVVGIGAANMWKVLYNTLVFHWEDINTFFVGPNQL